MESIHPNETGRKTFFWYRVYCATLVFLYLCVSIGGIALIFVQPETREYSPRELQFMGGIYAAVGLIFLTISTIALLLPPKPYNWVVGIVMLAIGFTSCCFWPVVIPLLIFWIKPETQAFFGRKKTA